MKRIIITEKQLHSIVGNTINEDIKNNDNIIELPKETLSKLIEELREEIEKKIEWGETIDYKSFTIETDNIDDNYFEFGINLVYRSYKDYQGNYYERSEYVHIYKVHITYCTVQQCINDEYDEWRTGKLSDEQISYIEDELYYEDVHYR